MLSAKHLRFATLLSLGIVATPFYTAAQAPAVATGDTRTVAEPSFPAVCQVLQASFHDANEDVPASIEQTSTNLDQARLQAALTGCAGKGQAVELSMDSAGNNAFLTGPITIPSAVTLLVDPGVTLYFSRNAQDYDSNPGTHTCGTVNNASNTASCKNLITMNGISGAGIMGYGKLNGRGGDVVLNSFPTSGFEGSTAGKTWWDLANDANTLGGAQQNPRMLQISNSHDITLYKITFKNSPNFHVALNGVQNFTVWGMHIVTPYSARNTDGIDPGSVTNATITQSWISDGDDNIAVGANASPAANISVINNRFFAGHGESIGSITTYGVNNVLFDNNAMYGDADVDGSNSTAIRIKSANDRGGLVQNIQYSNSCFANHGTQMQFTPVYNTNTGTLTPNFNNILLQNLRFSNAGPTATGSFTFLGASNNGVVNPLTLTLDNVTVDTVASSNLVAPVNAHITLGPGQVSSNLVSLLQPYNGQNGNIITDARTASSLMPPACNFTFLSDSLTGPLGTNQVVTTGQYPTAVVILQPAFASSAYPYPTGTVTVTDEAGRSFKATLPGTGDTVFVPITNAPAGTHTYTATYSGDQVYPAISAFGNYSVVVSGANLPSTTTTLTGVPATSAFGTSFTATAQVSGSNNPGGSVTFLLNGAAYATVPLNGGVASVLLNQAVGSYAVAAVYSGDSANAGSASPVANVGVVSAATTTTLSAGSSTGLVGTPVALSATVQSMAGAPTGTVTFSYTNASTSTPVTLGTSTLSGATASYAALLPASLDTISATYNGSTNFAPSVSTNPLSITVSAVPPVPASTAPVALPYTISTLVGGGTSNATCAGHVDSVGDGCQGTAVVLASGTDLRSVVGDPFGNVYFTDAGSSLVRKVAPGGVVTQFAGYVSGTTCTPTSTAGCVPTQVKLGGKPRGIYVDPNGNLFIAGYGDNKVYEVRATDGKMYVVAGTGSAPSNTTDPAGDTGLADSALLKGPRGVATDAAGNIYIADSGDNRIREVLLPSAGLPGKGTIQTIVGTGVASDTGDGGLGTQATLNNPQGVAVDASGNVYIAQGSHVRVLCVNCAAGSGLATLLSKLGINNPGNGNVYSVAGTSSSTNTALTPGLGTTVSMSPQKLVLDADGNLYIADSTNNVVWFEDGRTGYTRVLAGGGTGTSCAASTIGDSCPATQAVIGSNGGNGFGVGLDSQGNLYIADSTNARIRKVATNLRFGNVAVGSAITQVVDLHSQPGDSFLGVTATGSEYKVATGACTVLSDTTQDCRYAVTFSPVAAGPRPATLAVTSAKGNSGSFALAGLGLGAGATLDPAVQRTFGQNVSPASIAIEPSGSVVLADSTTGSVLRFAQGTSGTGGGITAVSTSVGSFTKPAAVASDALGDVLVADASTGLISVIAPNGTTSTLKPSFATPVALAVDSMNNVYVLDSTAKTVTEVGANGIATRTIASGLSAPTSIAADGSNNIYVGDAGAVYRYDAQTLTRATVTSAAASPAAIAVDAAGNLLIADSSTGSLLAVPASPQSATFTLATGVPANTLALDSAGNVYTSSPARQVLELLRTQGTLNYNGASSTSKTATLLSIGNMAAGLTISNPDSTDFSAAAISSGDCASSGNTLTVAVGGVCSFNTSFTPSGSANYTNTITFAGNEANVNLASPSALLLTQTGVSATAPAQGTVQLIATASITRVSGAYQVTVTLQNSGSAAASNVVLTGLSLGASTATTLPVSLGSVPAGGVVAATVSVPASAGADGSVVLQKITGTYNGGSFGGSLRTRLP